MATIEKKSWPEQFKLIQSGKKNFDLRLNDFRCNPGDTLVLREWNPKTKRYTGKELKRKVSYVMKTKSLKFWKAGEAQEKGLQVITWK